MKLFPKSIGVYKWIKKASIKMFKYLNRLESTDYYKLLKRAGPILIFDFLILLGLPKAREKNSERDAVFSWFSAPWTELFSEFVIFEDVLT